MQGYKPLLNDAADRDPHISCHDVGAIIEAASQRKTLAVGSMN